MYFILFFVNLVNKHTVIMAFINDDFMLYSDAAHELFNVHAEKMPIIDYYSHLMPQQIAENYFNF